jgi:hypothetical protein
MRNDVRDACRRSIGHISPGPSGGYVEEIVSMIQDQIVVAKWMSERRIFRADLTLSRCQCAPSHYTPDVKA